MPSPLIAVKLLPCYAYCRSIIVHHHFTSYICSLRNGTRRYLSNIGRLVWHSLFSIITLDRISLFHHPAAATRAGDIRLDGLGFHEWVVALDFIISHNDKCCHDDKPIKVVADDRAVCCRVLPAKNGIEDSPAATAIELWVAKLRVLQNVKISRKTYIDVPDALVNIVRSCTGSCLCCIASGNVVPVLSLKVPHCL